MRQETELQDTPPPKYSGRSYVRWIVMGVALLVIAGAFGMAGQFPEQNGHYGFWSVLPPLVAIVLAFWTREVVSSLFIGIVLGGFPASLISSRSS